MAHTIKTVMLQANPGTQEFRSTSSSHTQHRHQEHHHRQQVRFLASLREMQGIAYTITRGEQRIPSIFVLVLGMEMPRLCCDLPLHREASNLTLST